MNNMIAANGHWEPTQLPIMPLMSNVNVTYGPGDPSGRWYDSVGGTVNYVPVQPATTPGFTFSGGVDYGSYNTRSTHLILRTGTLKGWSAVVSGGYTANDTFRTGAFNAPSHGWAGYGKVRKHFQGGDFSVGYYAGQDYEYRPNFIPLTPIDQNGDRITTRGLYRADALPGSTVSADAPLYSQATSGYYSSLDQSLWFKEIEVKSDLVYSKLHLQLAPHLTLRDNLWYRHGYRLHYRTVNFYGPGDATNTEWYYPNSNIYGNQLDVDWDLPRNTVTAGGYLMHGDYNPIVANYNPVLGTSRTIPALYNSAHVYNSYGMLFLQDRIDAVTKLSITPGLSEQLFQTSFYNSGHADFPLASPADTNSRAPDSQKTFTRFSLSVSLEYAPSSRLAFHGNVAQTHQNPIDRAFGVYASPAGVDLAGLLPVKSLDTEGGVRVDPCGNGSLGHCSVDATYYRDRLSDETMEVTTSSPTALTEFAFGSAVYDGVALSFDEVPSWHLQIHGNATFQHDYFLHYRPAGSTVDFAGYPVSDSPDFTANVGLTTYVEAGQQALLTPQLWWQYVGRRYLFSNVVNGPTRQTMPGYGLVNFMLSLSLNRLGGFGGKAPIQVSFGVLNLLNAQYNPTAYITSGGYFGTSFGGYTLVDPGAPREYAVSVDLGF